MRNLVPIFAKSPLVPTRIANVSTSVNISVLIIVLAKAEIVVVLVCSRIQNGLIVTTHGLLYVIVGAGAAVII